MKATHDRSATPVMTPALDRLFDVFASVVIVLAFAYLAWHIALAVTR